MKSATDKPQPSKAGCLVPLPPDRLISLAELTNATAAVVEPNDCTYRMVDRQTPRAVGSFSPREMAKDVHIVALMSAIDGGTVTARSLHTRVPYGESEHIHSDWARTSVAYGLTYADAEKFCESLALEARPIDAEAMQAEPVVADSASTAPSDAPPPVATGDVAHAFDGLRGWSEKAWKDTLGSPPKWLDACIAIRGQRGVRETRWNPVLIGAVLVDKGHAKQNNIRARFQTRPQLQAWFEAWKTYEADNFDTQ